MILNIRALIDDDKCFIDKASKACNIRVRATAVTV